jgi:hypothetical protein
LRVERNLTANEEETVGGDSLGVRANSFGGEIGGNYFDTHFIFVLSIVYCDDDNNNLVSI